MDRIQQVIGHHNTYIPFIPMANVHPNCSITTTISCKYAFWPHVRTSHTATRSPKQGSPARRGQAATCALICDTAFPENQERVLINPSTLTTTWPLFFSVIHPRSPRPHRLSPSPTNSCYSCPYCLPTFRPSATYVNLTPESQIEPPSSHPNDCRPRAFSNTVNENRIEIEAGIEPSGAIGQQDGIIETRTRLMTTLLTTLTK